jgi:hypothetical protein
MACLGLGRVSGLAGAVSGAPYQETHKFDVMTDRPISTRQMAQIANRGFITLINTLREEMDEQEVIHLLNVNSENIGRMQGAAQAQASPDNSFKTFVGFFRPPAFEESLTHKVVEDTEGTFELEVTECIWASVFRDAGLGGEIGHAAVCNMDYHMPPAFNPDIKMVRSKTLMQGHDCCNHRYLTTAVR